MPKLPFSFHLYQFLTRLISLFLPLILNLRIKNGKELEASKPQRYGDIEFKKKKEKLIWIHAASVGESAIGINIARIFYNELPQIKFLFTAQTIAAAHVFEKANLPNAFFQFAPIDTPKIAKKFIDNLSPDLAIFIEGEIWPNLLNELSNSNIKKILINARLTDKSITNWNRYKALSNMLFGGFDYIHAANIKTQNALSNLTQKPIDDVGNLKFATPAPYIDEMLVKSIKKQTMGRKIWLCASSHEGEEEIILKAHKMLLEKNENALLIIAPRHLSRAQAIFDIAQSHQLKAQFKTDNQTISNETNIYIWNTLGEMGSAFKIADASFMAGSLLEKIGGHNPIEPAQLDCPIISGPYFHNFQDIYDEMANNFCVIITKNATEKLVYDAVFEILNNEEKSKKLALNASEFIKINNIIMNKIISKIKGLI